MGAAQHIGLHPHGLQQAVLFPERPAQFLRLTVQAVQIVMGLLQYEGSGGVVLLRLFGGGGELIEGVQPHGHLYALELLLHFQIFLSLFRLSFQRLQLQFKLGDLVPDAQQVVLRPLQLPLGFLFSVAVFGDTGGLFKNLPAVSAFQRQNFVNAALADVGVALPAQARVHQQLIDVLESGGLTVDIVFSVTGAVIPAGDHHLVGVIGQGSVGVVQGQRGLREAQLGTLGRAAENNVLHFGAPKGFGALFAHDPENGIGNIGLSRAVGAHNGGNVISKPDHRFIREGLKAL